MERRNSIRAAIQGLLTPVPQSDEQPLALNPRPAQVTPPDQLQASKACGRLFGEIQADLREHGVAAEVHEIAHALLEALAARPALCRGLFASYMLDDN